MTTVNITRVKNQLNSGSRFFILASASSLSRGCGVSATSVTRERKLSACALNGSSRSPGDCMSVRYDDTRSLTSDARSPACLCPHEPSGLLELVLRRESSRSISGTRRTVDPAARAGAARVVCEEEGGGDGSLSRRGGENFVVSVRYTVYGPFRISGLVSLGLRKSVV